MRALLPVCGLLVVVNAAGMPTVSAQGDHTGLRASKPVAAYGVLCEHTPGELARTADRQQQRDVTFTGVVLSEDERVAGTLEVVLTLAAARRHTNYKGHITVHTRALDGKGTWHGTLDGRVEGSKAWSDPAALALDIVHRRTTLRASRSGPGRTARPADARVVRRYLRGTGTLEGMRLVFDHQANVGAPPPETKLPPGCIADYELWSGVVADIRR
jgi:hypothetical protein